MRLPSGKVKFAYYLPVTVSTIAFEESQAMLASLSTSMRNASHRPGHVTSRGFTLVEIMVVVVIIGLLAALALPAFQRTQRATQNSRAINDFRVFVQAFEVYNTQNGAWPANAGAGVVPTGMSKDFKEDTWKAQVNILGGRWNWDVNRAEFMAGVSISGATASDEQLTEIDVKIDDGNLSTGLFQKISSSPTRVSYILEANP
jgi:type IV pilus assembly protein PilA